MSTLQGPSPRAAVASEPPTANDRFKDGFRVKLGLSLLLATTLHLVAFKAWPVMHAEEIAMTATDVELLSLPPEIEIPSAPARIARPAAPVASADVSFEETLPVLGWEEVKELPLPPPPPSVSEVRPDAFIPFTPYTVAPRLLNAAEMEIALQRAYPSTLKDAGVGGTVMLLVHVDDRGRVLEARVRETSGFNNLDAAALGLAEMMRYSPAMNRDIKVAVWITIPLIFEVK